MTRIVFASPYFATTKGHRVIADLIRSAVTSMPRTVYYGFPFGEPLLGGMLRTIMQQPESADELTILLLDWPNLHSHDIVKRVKAEWPVVLIAGLCMHEPYEFGVKSAFGIDVIIEMEPNAARWRETVNPNLPVVTGGPVTRELNLTDVDPSLRQSSIWAMAEAMMEHRAVAILGGLPSERDVIIDVARRYASDANIDLITTYDIAKMLRVSRTDPAVMHLAHRAKIVICPTGYSASWELSRYRQQRLHDVIWVHLPRAVEDCKTRLEQIESGTVAQSVNLSLVPALLAVVEAGERGYLGSDSDGHLEDSGGDNGS